MKRLTRALAILLSATMLLGNVTPAYATEMIVEEVTEAEKETVEAEKEVTEAEKETVEAEEEVTEATEEPAEVMGEVTEATEEPAEIVEETNEAEEVTETITEEEQEEEADEIQKLPGFSTVYVNPLYEDVVSEEDILQATGVAAVDEDAEYVDTVDEAGELMKNEMIQRNESVEINYKSNSSFDQETFDALIKGIASKAVSHTGNPREGDYLAWQYGGYQASAGGYAQNGTYYYTLTFNVHYYTTVEQENAVDAALETVLNDLALDGKSDYEKVKAIYDFICGHVTYDHANLNDDSYKLKHTAYAALINKTSVCQGYALLFYRMALEEGIDARIITGWAGENHAWNIVELDDLYYNLDSTWDAGLSDKDYRYFLQNAEGFSDHYRGDDYTTDAFYAEYPMAEEVFVPGEEGTKSDLELSIQKNSAGNAKYIVVKNNGTEYISCELSLVLENNDELEKFWLDYAYLGAGQSSKIRLDRIKECLPLEPVLGDYYIAVHPMDSYDEREYVKLKDFPVVISGETIEKTTVSLGNLTGNWFFTDFPVSEYDAGKVQIHYENSWGNGTDYLDTYNENYEYLYCDINSYIESSEITNYGAISFAAYKANAESDRYVITQYKTTNFEQGTYKETQLTVPGYKVLKDADGNIYALELINNDSETVDICLDLVPEGADPEGAKYGTNYEVDANASEIVYLKYLFERFVNIEAGKYYINIYAKQWDSDNVPSTNVKVKSCPIEVSEVQAESVQIDIGDVTGEYYFPAYSPENYNGAWAKFGYTNYGYEYEEEIDAIESRQGCFSVRADYIPDYWENVEVKEFAAYQLYGKSGSYHISKAISNTFNYGVFVEPKIPAPSIELYRDETGKIAGITVTNNIVNNDGYVEIHLSDGDTYSNIWAESMESGECKNILFEELELDDIEWMAEYENLRIEGFAEDDEVYYESPMAVLDCPIDVTKSAYTGNGVHIEAEPYGQDYYYYLPVEELPVDTNVQKILYYDMDEEWADWSIPELTKDKKFWVFEISKSLDEIDPCGVLLNSVNASETGIIFDFVEIPEEKVSAASREMTEEKVLFLDYDFYQAFVASGGGISFDGDTGLFESILDSFTNQNDKWSLEFFVKSFLGTKAYDVINLLKTNLLEEANKYWKCAVGSFQPTAMYDVSGNEIEEANIIDTDVVLVKYEPEIVWVDSMQLSAPEQLDLGSTGTVTAQLDAGQDKYPFKETPVIRYESSDEKLATVDPVTGVVTAGNAHGMVTITAYADEALRASEGLDEIVTASITIKIGKGDPNIFELAYTVLEDGTASISGFSGKVPAEVVIPATIGGYKVTEIGMNAFANCSNLKKVVIQGEKVVVEANAFNECKNLENFVVEGSLSTIGDYAFFNCISLKEIELSETVTSIGENAFSKGVQDEEPYKNLNLTIDCINKSYAHTWAVEHGFKVSFGDSYKVVLNTNGGMVASGDIIEYQEGFGAILPTDVTKVGYVFAGWYAEKDFSGNAVTEIPVRSTGDKVFYAKWNLNTKFSLVPADTAVVIPYENGEWSFAKTHVFLETDPIGYTIDNSKATVTVTDPAGNSKKADNFNFEIDMPGTYTVVAEYRYGEEPADVAVTEAVEITAVYGKRPYPINQQIRWNGISNLEKGLKFGDIIDEISAKLTADMQLNAEIGENLRDGNITIKNAKGKYVYNDTTNNAVSNGTYTVIYTLSDYNAETEERFFETAEAELIVNYTAFSLGEFTYSLTEEESERGRTAGTTIAAPILNESTGVYENGTSYGSAVVITPMFHVFEEQLTAPELRDMGYEVAFEITESGKSAGLTISEEENGGVTVAYNVESGVKVPATTTLNVKAVITAGDKEVTLTKAIKNFKVVSGGIHVVETISVEILDESGNSLEAVSEEGKTDVYLMNAEDMTAAKVSYALDLNVRNYAGEDYEGRLKDAKLKWSTSNKKLAEVKTDANGNATLVVNKGAVGTVDLTVTANDAGKESYTFKLFILDTEVRVDSTKLTMNSYLEEPGILKIYPNVASLEEAANKVNEDWDVEITVLEGEEFFDVDTDNYDKETGVLNVAFVDEEAANKIYTLKLQVRQYVGDFETEDELIFKITNKKAKPKLTLKAVSPYNIAYKNEAGYAEVLINLTAPISFNEGEPAIFINSDLFRLESLEMVSDKQWSAKLSMNDVPELKANKTKSFAMEVSAEYDGYRVESTASGKVSATNKTPSMTVYGNEVNKATLYPQLALEETKVLIALPEGIAEDGMYANAVDGTLTLGDTVVSITEATAKKFEIVEGEFVSGATSVDSKGKEITVGDAVLVTVRSILGEKAKSANIQFVVENNEILTNAVTTKTLKVYVEKVTSLAMSMLEQQTGKKTTSITFQKSFAGKELLTLLPSVPEQIIKIYEMNGMDASDHLILKVEAADKNAAKVLGNNTLIVEENSDGNVEIKTVEGLFGQGVSSCKVKFTVYAMNDGIENALKSATLTVKLKTKDTKISAKAAVKGNLNVVSPDSSVTVTPTFSNLPVGAQVIDVDFANDADAASYKVSDLQENGVVNISKFEKNTVLPIAKNTVPLVYKIQLMGGTTITAQATAKINVTQTATIKADVKTVTLYNSVIGASYGKEVVFTETKAGAAIKDIVFTGLEKSGISTEQSTGENGERIVNFYVDDTKDRGIKKTYTVKATVTLEGAGTKKDKEVTYTTSLKVTLNN